MILPFACLSVVLSLASAECFEPTPAFPPPSYDAEHPLLHQAFAEISSALSLVLAGPAYNTTSFSVEVTSSKQSLWSQHYTARERNESHHDVESVDGDTLYRIASITKTFTVLGLLQQDAAGHLSLDDTIDTYVEELKEKQDGSLPWKDITLRSLASQLSGIPREFAQSDIINGFPDPWQYGLPPVSREGLLKCDEYAQNYSPPCGKKDLIKMVKSYDPIFAPNQKSMYSNIAFELLGLALENVTGQSYTSYISQAIFDPLNMTRSSIATPPESHGVIPKGEQYWGVDEGVQNPTGGIYSSSVDLSKYLRYILTHYNGITHAVNWLHPQSPTDGLQSFYGMPWEMFRTASIFSDSKRVVSFITKSGGLPGYTTLIVLMPEYDLGITLLMAGTGGDLYELLEIVAIQLAQVADKLAIEQLQKRYQGTYTASDHDLNSSITLLADHRGLILSQFISNGTDFLHGDLTKLIAPKDRPWFVQLLPTLLYRNEEEQEGEKWRFLIVPERKGGKGRIFDEFCVVNVDMPSYSGIPINEMVIWGDGKDEAGTLELPAFRVKLQRDSKEKGGSGAKREQSENLEMK